MMRNTIKRLLSWLPRRRLQEIRRLYYARQVRRGDFTTDEPEFARLDSWLHEGDWVLDVGANVGHYTCRLSQLVGLQGRVIAFEPVAETFDLLTSNVAQLSTQNVTLLNVAASDQTRLAGMTVPMLPTGLPNLYMARLSKQNADFHALCLPIDGLGIRTAIRLVKIDAEGHELSVLSGMRLLLEESHPTLIVEGSAPAVVAFLGDLGYSSKRYGDSPNRVYYWGNDG